MLMLEHDAKEILSRHGVPVPPGVLVAGAAVPALPFAGPAVVKAQVPTGGRGKAGGIRRAERASELPAILAQLLGSRVRGHTVGECRIEQAVVGAEERYLSFSIEPASAAVTVLASGSGGVDVEEAPPDAPHRASAALDRAALETALDDLVPAFGAPLAQAGRLLAGLFLDLELTLLEINPLFVLEDGSFVVGDVKLIADDNALVRQPELAALVAARRHAYPDAAFKLEHGFDFVLLDPDGEVGLVTTGAGLSMQLVDEVIRAGARPYNFLDIRTGMMRGRPDRLILVLRQIARGPRIRSVLVNIFAGITELGEFARLLLEALAAVPELQAQLVVRLVGNGEDQAAALLERCGRPMILERDLERAVALAVRADA
jgi:succinyl-CoA synthetase beta subunit